MGNIIDISEIRLELGLAETITDVERAVCEAAIVKAEAAVIAFLRYDPVQRTRTEFYPQAAKPAGSVVAGHFVDAPAGQMVQRQYSGQSSLQLCLKHLPLRSITSLHIDYDGRFGTKPGAFGSGTEKTEGVDFWPAYDEPGVCRDGILHSYGYWPIEPGSVKVIYVAGYTAAELHGQGTTVNAAAIATVAINEAARRAKRAFLQAKSNTSGWSAGTLQSESLGDYSYSLGGNSSSSAASFDYGSAELAAASKQELQDFVNYSVML